MRHFDTHWLLSGVAQQMWRVARSGTWDGRGITGTNTYFAEYRKPYFERCKAFHVQTGTVLIFTRDEGMHSAGWWKNPDYERCYHLSLSFKDPLTMKPAPRDVRLSKEWVEAFYRDDKRLVWAESPYSDEGKSAEVWHYRVFCDEHWRPLLPRKEVYTREFTELGWKSFSELGFEVHPVMQEA
jgi:hypothetical protein